MRSGWVGGSVGGWVGGWLGGAGENLAWFRADQFDEDDSQDVEENQSFFSGEGRERGGAAALFGGFVVGSLVGLWADFCVSLWIGLIVGWLFCALVGWCVGSSLIFPPPSQRTAEDALALSPFWSGFTGASTWGRW